MQARLIDRRLQLTALATSVALAAAPVGAQSTGKVLTPPRPADTSAHPRPAGFNYDGYSSGGYTFSVERSDSGWVVKQWRMEWTARSGAP